MSNKLLEIAIKNSLDKNKNFDFSNVINKSNVNFVGTDINELPLEVEESSWSTINDDSKTYLSKTYIFNSQRHLIYFINETIVKSDLMNHHPIVILNHNQVTVQLYTHELNDVTDQDIALKTHIDEIYDDILFLNE